MSTKITILTEWDRSPFYYRRGDDAEGYDWSIEETGEYLGLSADLVRDLAAWDNQWQDTLDLAEGRNSGFRTEEEALPWIERGKELAARVQKESTLDISVDYQANGVIAEGTYVF
ncbi:hypothetical protein [Actinoalloteichus hymeniacidonis]|uniref:Uncharacterized protein n=1 Tax=Actinoalloteichus hymeniacidonis TaxID=340345 RepID=A0AAC9MW92_9PSEU|nr:hypothetical protein [Actinoalloteichus hymeniacidonis]AOS61035.1 hypothetical protein TL08_00955 [Actinoalloteichus hymeniacidonis]MBB5910965.1 hypothetical protein [Actinoalloteichus hymeniacidonis]